MTSSKLHVATVATDKRFYFPFLVESCRRNGVELTVLGLGQTWQGYTWKMTQMRSFLQEVEPDDLVCFVDAYDVVCLRPLEDIVPTFEQICKREDCRIIMGHDTTHLVGEIAGRLMFGSCHGKRLNAGTYIGRAQDLLEILEESQALDPGHHDDQILMTELCCMRPNDFYVDTGREMFYSYANSLNEIRVPSDAKPFFVHGNASTFLNELLISHEYEDIYNKKKHINTELFWYVVEKLLHHWYVFLTLYWFLTVPFVMFLASCIYFCLSKGPIRRRNTARLLLTGGGVLVALPFLFCVGYVLCSDFVWLP